MVKCSTNRDHLFVSINNLLTSENYIRDFAQLNSLFHPPDRSSAALNSFRKGCSSLTICDCLFCQMDDSKEDYSHLPPTQQKKKLCQKIEALKQSVAKDTAERWDAIKTVRILWCFPANRKIKMAICNHQIERCKLTVLCLIWWSANFVTGKKLGGKFDWWGQPGLKC